VGLVKRCALVGGKGEDMVTHHVTHPLMSLILPSILRQRPDLKTNHGKKLNRCIRRKSLSIRVDQSLS
jgi:hypothetical protein